MRDEQHDEDAPVVECTVVIRPDSMPKASLTTWPQWEDENPLRHLRKTEGYSCRRLMTRLSLIDYTACRPASFCRPTLRPAATALINMLSHSGMQSLSIELG